MLYVLLTAVLCFVTASGLKRNKRWGRYAAYLACALLLLGCPWLTIAGAAGIYFLRTTKWGGPPAKAAIPAAPSKDFWR
jgi:hypothetical protein